MMKRIGNRGASPAIRPAGHVDDVQTSAPVAREEPTKKVEAADADPEEQRRQPAPEEIVDGTRERFNNDALAAQRAARISDGEVGETITATETERLRLEAQAAAAAAPKAPSLGDHIKKSLNGLSTERLEALAAKQAALKNILG